MLLLLRQKFKALQSLGLEKARLDTNNFIVCQVTIHDEIDVKSDAHTGAFRVHLL